MCCKSVIAARLNLPRSFQCTTALTAACRRPSAQPRITLPISATQPFWPLSSCPGHSVIHCSTGYVLERPARPGCGGRRKNDRCTTSTLLKLFLLQLLLRLLLLVLLQLLPLVLLLLLLPLLLLLLLLLLLPLPLLLVDSAAVSAIFFTKVVGSCVLFVVVW